MEKIKSFSNETIEKLNYYVYRLIDPRNGQTFYVGKGKGNRVFAHVQSAIGYYEGAENSEDADPNKIKIIRDIIDAGLEVIHVIQRWNLSEEEAFQVEAALIDVYQGLSNLQSGHYSEYGVTNAEALERELSLITYDEPTDFKYIIIKVKKWRLDELLADYPKDNRYQATRFAWRIRPRDVKEYPYAFSVTEGVVKEVYKINEWYYVEERERYAFNGELAPETIRNRFVGKRIPEYYMKKGMASPVLFSKNK